MSNVELEWRGPLGLIVTDNPWGMWATAVGFVLYVLLAIGGCRLVFRGTRDYIRVTMGKGLTGARIAAAIAAVVLFVSGWSPLVTIASWLAGVPAIGRWPSPHDPFKRTPAADDATPQP